MKGVLLVVCLAIAPLLLWPLATIARPGVAPAFQATPTPRVAYFPLILKNARRPYPTPVPIRTPTITPSPRPATPTPTLTPQPTRIVCDMNCRVDAVIRVLASASTCQAIDDALDQAMEVLYGGLRPLPSKDLLDQTRRADDVARAAETRLAQALEALTRREVCPAQHDRALDLKLFIEQMDEVAQAVGAVTARCGAGDSLTQPPCDELQPGLDEDTGQETTRLAPPAPAHLSPSYAVKLRSPAVAPWIRGWQEDVRMTAPIPAGQCVVIPKESKGLMLRLHFDRVTVVTDPWVTTFGVPRGSQVPIWRLEWVAAQYFKEWNICNPTGRGIVKTVTQRVVQDIPLNYFWRFYRKDP